MKTVNTDSVLAQMQALAARAKALEQTTQGLTTASEAAQPTGVGRFAELVSESTAKINETVKEAESASAALIREDPGANLVDTMVAVNKAQVSFRMLVEVRNRLIQAYQDVANMPI